MVYVCTFVFLFPITSPTRHVCKYSTKLPWIRDVWLLTSSKTWPSNLSYLSGKTNYLVIFWGLLRATHHEFIHQSGASDISRAWTDRVSRIQVCWCWKAVLKEHDWPKKTLNDWKWWCRYFRVYDNFPSFHVNIRCIIIKIIH